MLISLGTGRRTPARGPNDRSKAELWVKTVVRVLTDSQRTAELVQKRLAGAEGRYFRLDPPEVGDVLLDSVDAAEIASLEDKTKAWCESDEGRIARTSTPSDHSSSSAGGAEAKAGAAAIPGQGGRLVAAAVQTLRAAVVGCASEQVRGTLICCGALRTPRCHIPCHVAVL